MRHINVETDTGKIILEFTQLDIIIRGDEKYINIEI